MHLHNWSQTDLPLCEKARQQYPSFPWLTTPHREEGTALTLRIVTVYLWSPLTAANNLKTIFNYIIWANCKCHRQTFHCVKRPGNSIRLFHDSPHPTGKKEQHRVGQEACLIANCSPPGSLYGRLSSHKEEYQHWDHQFHSPTAKHTHELFQYIVWLE